MSAALDVTRAPMVPRPARIARVERETADTFTLHLEPPDGKLAFMPGQFNMLYVFGVGEVPISISGDPEAPEVLVHTIRAVGAVTRALQALSVGDVVGVRGPYGNHWPVAEGVRRDLVVVAGGIGLAPLRPVVLHALAHRGDFDRVYLLYGTRTPADILFEAELRAWRARFDFEVEVTVDRGVAGWSGRTGVVTTLIERADYAPESAVAMVCGPEVMMRFAARELAQSGVEADRIYVSLERKMKCGIGQCGNCQLGPELLCRDGPIYPYTQARRLLAVREL
jgi:NAD(P)H-flavin reductase